MPIKILPEDIVNQIAAGEVVERPASVVKELVENSLDAGAGTIEVEIARGGLGLIRVSDDGCGMSPEDIRLSLQRHATSKITAYHDLQSISSYGFRGEALPSIASVSQLTLLSRRQADASAWMVASDGGNILRDRSEAGGQGTTVRVEELFAKVPARRKFLKTEMTESRKVAEEVASQAMVHPGTSFRLLIDGRVGFDYQPGTLSQRLEDILTTETFGRMAPVEFGQKPLRITGYMLKPDQLLPRRRDQYLFVNGRRISDRMVSSAVYQGYGAALLGRHPAFALFLEISPGQVDINVHPAKREVRFRDESLVFNTVRLGIQRALFGWQEARKPEPSFAMAPAPAGLESQEPRDVFAAGSAAPEDFVSGGGSLFPSAHPRRESFSLINHWQVHDRYIFAAIKNGIIMVDQHAAHERILFEELLKTQERGTSQQLLFPVSLDLTSGQLLAFEQFKETFARLGFEIKMFSGNTIVIEGLPAAAGDRVEGGRLVLSILEELCLNPEASVQPAERLARSFACHAAIKAGQPLTQEEMNRLIDRLFATTTPYLDPHGRPAVIKFTIEELERRFGRV
jgi:DNA mismatch repair protein MutL